MLSNCTSLRLFLRSTIKPTLRSVRGIGGAVPCVGLVRGFGARRRALGADHRCAVRGNAREICVRAIAWLGAFDCVA